MATSWLAKLLRRSRRRSRAIGMESVPHLPRSFGDETAVIQSGVICIPDVSGYTGLVSTVELVHAHEIVTRLIRRIMSAGWEVLEVSKLVGDAVLLYRGDVQGQDGAAIQREVLDTVRSIYSGFVQERTATQQDRHACGCAACQGIDGLDLKFILHHGEYLVYDLPPFRELMGRDVIVAFRLLKNDVPAHRYALMTDDFMGLDRGVESLLSGSVDQAYEHLGTVRVGWLDPAVSPSSSTPRSA